MSLKSKTETERLTGKNNKNTAVIEIQQTSMKHLFDTYGTRARAQDRDGSLIKALHQK